jgi:hypothetical protein
MDRRILGVCLITAAGFIVLVAPSTSAHAHGSYCYAGNYGSWPPDNQVQAGNSYIFGLCTTVGAGSYFQQSGYHYVSQVAGYGTSWYYVQHNSDEYIQESLNGPPCTYAAGYPYCAYYGSWSWYLYWQRNPDNWKSQQVNTWSGGPYWHRSGWF